MPRLHPFLLLTAVAVLAGAAQAQEPVAPVAASPGTAATPTSTEPVPPVAPEAVHVAINRLMDASWQKSGITPAPLSSDAEFLRRVTLDLIGRIPTIEESRAFLANTSPSKRSEAIDALLVMPEYARHMQHQFDVMLMRRLPQKHVPVAEWQKFLRDSFSQNKPWTQIAKEVLSADGLDEKNRGPARFYLDREAEVNTVTRDIAKVFLGADLLCAQCHDHPHYDGFKQAHYYGIAAYLNRTFLFTPKGKPAVLAEKADGEAKFKSVFIKDQAEMTATPRVFDGMVLQEVAFKPGEEYEVKPEKDKPEIRPIPKFSRRAFLAEAIASPDNPRFARTLVNQVWAMLLGRGIVHPVQLDHPDNPPAHPEVLDLLTREIKTHQFDVKWLIREIVLTSAYQRSSAPVDPAQVPPEESFACFPLKPLSPEQFCWSVLEASGEAAVHRKALAAGLNEEALFNRLASYQNRFVQLFGGQPGSPPTSYESTMEQVLFLANDGLINNLLPPKNGNTSGRALALPKDNDRAMVDELFLSVLSRPATDSEAQEFVSMLAGTEGDARRMAVQDSAWALLTSAEFRFNH